MFRRVVLVGGLLGVAAALASTAVPAASAAACDGQWQPVQSFDHSQLYGEIDSLNAVAALSSGDQWAVGSWTKYPEDYHFHTLIEHWDGTAGGWSVVPSPTLPLNSYLYGVSALAANDVWAVGGTDQSGPPYQSLVEHWDGVAWSLVAPASFPGVLYAVVARGPTDVWAVGTENYPGRGLIEHWDGITWTATYLRFGAVLRGVAAAGPRTIWAVGQRYGRTNPFGDTTLTMRFNGNGWTQVPSPNPLHTNDTDQDWLTSVSVVAPNDAWAVGRYGNHDLGPLDQTLVEHWNGSRWSVVPSPSPGGSSLTTISGESPRSRRTTSGLSAAWEPFSIRSSRLRWLCTGTAPPGRSPRSRRRRPASFSA
jgi:hypothetical protein